MKKVLLQLWVTTIVAMNIGVNVIAQGPPPPPLKPDRIVGAAEVFYFKDKNKIRAQVRIYLLGKPEDVGTKNDTLSMDVIFEVDGKKVTKPQFVTLAFSSYSAGKPKYQKDHDLQIYTEKVGDATRTTWRTRTVFSRQLPSGGTEEIYLSPAIEYSRILKMFDASLVGIILADSRFGLKKEDIKALKDLTETIEK